MAPKRKRAGESKFYAVRIGKTPGLYYTWDDCLEQVNGFKGAIYKSFPSLTDAETYLAGSDAPSKSKKAPKDQRFYGVRRGKVKGVYTDWPTAQEQTIGYYMPEYKGFATRLEAEEYVRGESANVLTEPVPKKSKIFAEDLPPGYGPLPPEAEDGFDHTLTLDPATGELRQKTAVELGALKAVSRSGPASEGEWVTIFTDGACRGNGKAAAIAGVGVWFGPDDPRNVAERLPGDRQTNQRAELTAVKRALDICPYNRNARIYSDSSYAIKCVTEWFSKWEKNGWKNSTGKPVDNRDIIEEILQRIRERQTCKSKTKFEWVKGHSDSIGNNAADVLAVQGALKTRSDTKTPTEDKQKEAFVADGQGS